ncbi:peptidoglycan-binding protein [Brachybacterium sp. GU-2]|uniref:peptidoglycan-binding protein n=1 Tax=Brachybacterium sp. GU-2 TaxID=3069708 RepID=UPI00280A5166|nr:peptidoglycan-binding protein [Brachybacterium sp. GU-2]WME22159.1 peptidoglycan-binding protein [Brachybacterium sp. GU-2]
MALLTLSRNDKRLVDLPTSWSNAGRHEQLQREAAESFSNLIALAVAKSGANFQLYDALRPIEEQIAMLQRNYRRVSRARSKSSDRTWDGSTWERRPGRPSTASPGWSNHGSGLAVDIHPGPIQEIFKSDGPAWGWSWEEGQENGESWHFVYVGGNRYASRGWLDHAWVQKVVGADVDGKIGTGTVKLIKAWQKAHGLEADGIVGPGTKKAMLGKGDAAPAAPAAPEGGTNAPAPERAHLGPADDGVFPWADSTTQFWDSKYPTQTYAGGKPIGLMHSTETGTWPGYGAGSSAPHLTVRFDPKARTISARQHFSTTRPSRALVNKAGGVQTNNARVFQIELIGSCDRDFATRHGYPFLPDLLDEVWARDALAGVLAAVAESLDIPLTTSVSWKAYPGSYGEKAGQRLSGKQWEEYTGWLGHQHAPENDHGDPGDIPIADVLAAARGGVPAPIVPSPSTPSTGGKLPEGKELFVKLTDCPDFPLLRTPDHLCYYGDEDKQESVSGKVPNSLVPGEIVGSGKSSGAQGLKRWQAKAGITADGRFGAKTKAKVKAVQKKAGLKVDGQLGPVTWYGLWLVS